MTHSLTIGQLSRETNCKVPTIRYYEQIGLMPAPARSLGNQRRYGPEHLARLRFIQHCRVLGFPQQTIRDLLDLTNTPGGDCDAVTRIARSHLDEVNRRIAHLAALRSELERMIDTCDGGQISECRIIGALADLARFPCRSDEPV